MIDIFGNLFKQIFANMFPYYILNVHIIEALIHYHE